MGGGGDRRIMSMGTVSSWLYHFAWKGKLVDRDKTFYYYFSRNNSFFIAFGSLLFLYYKTRFDCDTMQTVCVCVCVSWINF